MGGTFVVCFIVDIDEIVDHLCLNFLFTKMFFFPQYLTTIHLEYKHRIKSQIDFGNSNLNHKYKQEVPVCQYGRLAVVVSNCNKRVFLQDKTHIPVDAKLKVALT